MDNKLAKDNALNCQVATWGNYNQKVNQAINQITRENFVPGKWQNFTYADFDIPLNERSKMLSPKIVGRVLDALDIKNNHNVLEIGTGSGYVSAILSILAKKVWSLEIDTRLFNQAKQNLNKEKLSNITLINQDAFEFKTDTKFDIIVMNVAVFNLDERFLQMLSDNAKMLYFEAKKSFCKAKLIHKKSSQMTTKEIFETNIEHIIGGKTKTKFHL